MNGHFSSSGGCTSMQEMYAYLGISHNLCCHQSKSSLNQVTQCQLCAAKCTEGCYMYHPTSATSPKAIFTPCSPSPVQRILGQRKARLILWYVALATLGPDSARVYQVRFNAQTLTRSLLCLWTDSAVLYVVSLASFGLVNIAISR